mmetsp:Transcript_153994/g.295280  ORF Transcript_153994/g.295280 Transcript_153994/m.295280 type:complete len:258 (-) Transcript_153994:1667-2440(-)
MNSFWTIFSIWSAFSARAQFGEKGLLLPHCMPSWSLEPTPESSDSGGGSRDHCSFVRCRDRRRCFALLLFWSCVALLLLRFMMLMMVSVRLLVMLSFLLRVCVLSVLDRRVRLSSGSGSSSCASRCSPMMTPRMSPAVSLATSGVTLTTPLLISRLHCSFCLRHSHHGGGGCLPDVRVGMPQQRHRPPQGALAVGWCYATKCSDRAFPHMWLLVLEEPGTHVDRRAASFCNGYHHSDSHLPNLLVGVFEAFGDRMHS